MVNDSRNGNREKSRYVKSTLLQQWAGREMEETKNRIDNISK